MTGYSADSALAVLALAVALDLCVGEPPAAVHPVVWMGKLAGSVERALRGGTAARQLVSGAAVVAVVAGVSCAAAWVIVLWLQQWSAAAVVVGAALLKSTFALRMLVGETRRVQTHLAAGSIDRARAAVGRLCSRDTRTLAPNHLASAAIESLAENLCDSVVAPLFYFALGGIPAAVAYRAVNTLDAMFGYRGGRYEYFGKAAARLDDVLNFVPARVTAAALLVAGSVGGGDGARGLAVWRRDAGITPSPNSGRPMAVMAGLLGVQLEKVGVHRLGDACESIGAHHIGRAGRLAVAAAGLVAIAAAVAVEVVHG